MASKTISLEQSAYERLLAAKREGESFSDVVNRLTRGNEPSLLDLVGLVPPERAEQLRADITEMRRQQAEIADERARRFGWVE